MSAKDLIQLAADENGNVNIDEVLATLRAAVKDPDPPLTTGQVMEALRDAFNASVLYVQEQVVYLQVQQDAIARTLLKLLNPADTTQTKEVDVDEAMMQTAKFMELEYLASLYDRIERSADAAAERGE